MFVSCVVASVRLMNVENSMEDIVSFVFLYILFLTFRACRQMHNIPVAILSVCLSVTLAIHA